MSDPIEYIIPPWTSRWLAEVPRDRPVAMLVRHSVRGPLPAGKAGNAVPITDLGADLARTLGVQLSGRLASLHSSPVLRCIQTAECLRRGASVPLEVVEDRLLGDPGIYVVDSERAWGNWQEHDHAWVMRALVAGDRHLPGMAEPREAARFLVNHMLAAGRGRAGLHVFVTHDSLVTATAARTLDEPLGEDAWPWYLEAAFFWREGDDTVVAYRRWHARGSRKTRVFTESAVVEFARREIMRSLGPDCPARFFLAGGAFRTILTGRQPRDLDLWAPSDGDRAVLTRHIEARGGERLDELPYRDAYRLAGRVVEVPHRTDPGELEARFDRFDLALSAVGVEHSADGQIRAAMHPLAHRSIERREVLLLKPLVNWKHALSTLERARRYAADLEFSFPESEEAEIWRVFDAQSRDMQEGMLARYEGSGQGGYGVREEATCRLR